MANEVLDPLNPRVNDLLFVIRDQLRVALTPGSFGDIVQTEPAPVHDGKVKYWKLGFVPSVDLTQIGRSARK